MVNTGLSINVNQNTKHVTIEGDESFTLGSQLTSIVFNEKNKVSHINQVSRQENGRFAFDFAINATDEGGVYSVKIGGDGMQSPYYTHFFLSNFQSEIAVSSLTFRKFGGHTLEHLTSTTYLNISAQLANDGKVDLGGVSMFAALYNRDGVLVTCKYECKELLVGQVDTFKVNIPDLGGMELNNGYYIKVFVLEGLNVRPLAKMILFQ